MSRALMLLFGVLSYVLFLGTFVYQIGFVTGALVPKHINSGEVLPALQAAGIDVALLALFAVQHTIMARLVFKRWLTSFMPAAIERSLFVLLTSLILLLLNGTWAPLPDAVWHVESPAARLAIHGVAGLGWALVLGSTFLIDHFDLFGLRQVWLAFRGRPYTQVPFQERVLYHWVRHPLMLGFIVAFVATPDMSQGHLLFAAVTTAYILIAIHVEERTLVALHGDDYRHYQQRVSMIVPSRPKAARG